MIIKEKQIKKSRKSYYCDGNCQLGRHADENDPIQKTAWDQYKVCQGIKKGDSYYKQLQRCGSGLIEFKSCIPCWEQVGKFKFFCEDW